MNALKWILIVGVVSTILGGIGWTIDQLMDVSTLRANNITLTQTNSDSQEQLNFFRNDASQKEKQLAEKQREYDTIHDKYEGLKGEIEDAKQLLSEQEAACAESAVPDPYVDILHKRRETGSSKNRDNEGVSSENTVPAEGN